MFVKILKGIGIAFLSLVVLFVCVGIWSFYKSSEYENTAIPYLEIAIRDISGWDKQVMAGYMTASVVDTVSDDDLTVIVGALSKMGKLQSLGDYQFTDVSSKAIVGAESGTFVTYVVPAHYENGDATITVTLKEEGDSFSVYRFNLNSLTLLK